jgi:gamma-tubulin complex component 2
LTSGLGGGFEIPASLGERPFLKFDYLQVPREVSASPAARAAEEGALVTDILFGLVGIEGHALRIHRVEATGHPYFQLATPALSELYGPTLLRQLLSLCDAYVFLAHFCHSTLHFSTGYVLQAFGHGLDELLFEYLAFVAILNAEHQHRSLTVNQLWVLAQPYSEIMLALVALCQQVIGLAHDERLSCALLDLLDQQRELRKGDRALSEMLSYLFHGVFSAYRRFIIDWMYYGRIIDPFREFFIRDRHHGSPASEERGGPIHDWTSRFSLHSAAVPKIFRAQQELIYLGGKFLRAISHCGVASWEHLLDSEKRAAQFVSVDAFLAEIKRSHELVSRHLKYLIMEKCHLLATLHKMRHYLLGYRADFLTHFLDLCQELALPVAATSPLEKLNRCLELALRRCGLEEPHLLFSAPPDATPAATSPPLLLSYEVSWPLTIILSPAVQADYQTLFVDLFSLLRLERRLMGLWSSLQETKAIPVYSHARSLLRAWQLHAEIHHLVKGLLSYTAHIVSNSDSWTSFQQSCLAAPTAEELAREHQVFVDYLLGTILFKKADPEPHRTNTLAVCQVFCDYLERTLDKLFIRIRPLLRVAMTGERTKPAARREIRDQLEEAARTTLTELEAAGLPRILEKFSRNLETHYSRFLRAVKSINADFSTTRSLSLLFELLPPLRGSS